MINTQPYSMTITAQQDWMGNQYSVFAQRVAWIKSNFSIKIVVDTADTFQFTTRQSSLITIADVIDACKDRVSVVMRFA